MLQVLRSPADHWGSFTFPGRMVTGPYRTEGTIVLNQDQIKAIKAPFPTEALSADTSRDFELTSIKAAFVIERLNGVFGPCGIG